MPAPSAVDLPKRPAGRPAADEPVSSIAGFGRFPLSFVENQGQTDEQVGYYVASHGLTLYFTPGQLTYAVTGPTGPAPALDPGDPRAELCANRPRAARPDAACPTTPMGRWAVKVDFVGADQAVRPVGVEKTETIFSYFKGPESEWKTGLPSYSGVAYHDLWPGIDLVYGGQDGRLKYSFVVQPGADPGRIMLDYRGASDVRLTEGGGLRVETPLGGFTDQKPYAYQDVDGRQQEVSAGFALAADPEAGAYVSHFSVGSYDPSLPLVLDPVVLGYAGFIGSSSFDGADGVAVDSGGNAYVAGNTQSPTNFPVVAGPDTSYNGGINDVFVAKVNAAGTGLVYSGFIGGNGEDYAGNGNPIAVDGSGRAVVVGLTHSTQATSPSKVGPRTTRPNSSTAVGAGFIVRVNAAGTGLDYAGYVGGEGPTSVEGVALDSAGNAYIAGTLDSPQSQFPAKVGPDLTFAGGKGTIDPLDPSLNMPGTDAFVAKVNASGSDFVYAGFIGGAGDDRAAGIAVDSSGAAYVTGTVFVDSPRFTTADMDFYCVVGQSCTAHSTNEAFIVKVRPDGTGFAYAGYLGLATDGSVDAKGIAVDTAGFAYLVGEIWSATHGDAFLTKVAQNGSALVDATFIAGEDFDGGRAVAVDGSGTIYVAGRTYSTQLSPAPQGGPDVTFNGDQDAFVAKYNANGTLAYLGYIGGPDDEQATGIAVDGAGNAYVVGYFDSYNRPPGFPATVGPDTTANGDNDGFIAKVVVAPPPDIRPSAVFTLEGDAGSSPAVETVTLSHATSEIVTVHYQTGNNTATGGTSCSPGVDFVNVSGTLTFQPGETSKDVQIPICGDTVVEPDESLTFILSNPTNGLANSGPGSVTIRNDDQSPSVLSIADVKVGEGNSGTTSAVFQVTLSPASTQMATVNYATAGSSATAGTCGTSGVDFQSTSGTLTFGPSTTQQTITVPICGDTTHESDETFTVSLSGATNATISRGTATGTIVNDDDALPTVSISDTGNPETGDYLVFNPTLSRAIAQDVTVSYSTADGTAIGGAGCGGGADYVSQTNGTFTIQAGHTSPPSTLLVTICDDTVPEYAESLYVNLTGVTTGNATIARGQGVGTIFDFGDAQPTIAVNDVSWPEGDSGVKEYDFAVFLSKASGQPVEVNYATADGTAHAGTDYTAVSGTLTWQPGEFTKHVTVLVNGDTEIEGDETFFLNLSLPANAILADNQAVGTIQNDDALPVLTISGSSVTETNRGQTGVGLTVTLSKASTQTVTVHYATANGTATGGASCTAGVDYVTSSGTLTFNPGETIHTVPAAVCGDISFEPDETFTVTLASPTNATIGTATATATIKNDDLQPQALPSLSVTGVTVPEGNAGTSTAGFPVALSAAGGSTVTVQYATANGTATAGTCASGGDYQAANGTLTFNPGETSKSIPVTICGDTTVEANETFTVTLASPSGATISTATATGTITNDDAGGGPPAPACAPRPNPRLTVTHAPEPGRLQVTVTAVSSGQAPSNALQEVQFGAATNALVEVPGGGAGRAGSFTLPVGAGQTTFFVQRQAPGAFKVDMVIVDGCNGIAGPFKTFVGGGPSVP